MVPVDSPTRSLEVKLSGAVTTNQLPIVVNYNERTATGLNWESVNTQTNNTTAVTIISAPVNFIQRELIYLSIQNKDTVAATVILQLNDNATLRQILKFTLAVNDTLFYDESEGFYVMDSIGNRKTSEGSAGNHNDLSGLQGGSAGEYYHLTSTQHTGLTAATTVGLNVLALPNPSAIRWIRINADNTVSTRSDSETRTDLGLVIGTNVQAYDAALSSLAGVAWVQGDIPYFSAADTAAALAKDAGTSRFIKNSGASNNPAWAQPAFADLSDYTDWTDFSGSDAVVGFSALAAHVAIYCKLAKGYLVYVNFNGTSNAATVSFTLPFTVANLATNTNQLAAVITNNGTGATTPGLLSATLNTTAANCYRDRNATVFTTSGNKVFSIQMFFPTD